jgi:methanogenic corrinoid protein MtbC1
VVYLGADTPGSDLRDAVEASRPAVVVLAATSAQRFEAIRDDLAALIAAVPVAIAGAGATTGFAASLGALLLAEDPVTAAQTVASRHIPR